MTNALPLDGITLVAFSQILACPFCTLMLASPVRSWEAIIIPRSFTNGI